jgi:hypothetical protein
VTHDTDEQLGEMHANIVGEASKHVLGDWAAGGPEQRHELVQRPDHALHVDVQAALLGSAKAIGMVVQLASA